MTVKNPRNGLSFEQLQDMLEAERPTDPENAVVAVGNNTYAEWMADDGYEPFIAITLHETKVANVLSDDAVQLFDGGYKTVTVARRMDWVLLPLGFRMLTNNSGHGRVRWGQNASAFKVYSIDTGAYRDYTPGMIVERGAF